MKSLILLSKVTILITILIFILIIMLIIGIIRVIKHIKEKNMRIELLEGVVKAAKYEY